MTLHETIGYDTKPYLLTELAAPAQAMYASIGDASPWCHESTLCPTDPVLYQS